MIFITTSAFEIDVRQIFIQPEPTQPSYIGGYGGVIVDSGNGNSQEVIMWFLIILVGVIIILAMRFLLSVFRHTRE